jgi:hypothetical protein
VITAGTHGAEAVSADSGGLVRLVDHFVVLEFHLPYFKALASGNILFEAIIWRWRKLPRFFGGCVILMRFSHRDRFCASASVLLLDHGELILFLTTSWASEIELVLSTIIFNWRVKERRPHVGVHVTVGVRV